MRIQFLTIFGFGLLLMLIANSCAPIYKCGEEVPTQPISGSNRLIAVVKERDMLCEQLVIKDEETNYFLQQNQVLSFTNDSLKNEYQILNTKKDSIANEFSKLQTKHDDLKEDYMDLSTKYSTAITEKLNQGHLYDERLKEKERRMAIKEDELDEQKALLEQQKSLLEQQTADLESNTALLNAKNAELEEQLELMAERERQIQELENEIARKDSVTRRMNQALKEALLGFNSDDLKTEIKDGKVYILMSDNLMFASGKADIQTKGKEALKKLADVLKSNKEFQILVEGHTDNVPIKTARYKDNWDLSVDRATEIVRILQQAHGIEPLRLTASGKGEFLPRESNDTANGRAKNRRTEIILSPNLGELLDIINE